MLSVAQIMVSDPVTVAPDVSIREAAALMHARDINSLVVARNGDIVGILTSHDLLRQTAGATTIEAPVSAFMTPDPWTVEVDAPFGDAMTLMDQRRVRHLPVTRDGRLAGILSVRDLMHHRTRFLEDVVAQQTEELRRRHDLLEERDRNMRVHLELAGRVQRELLPVHVPDMPPLRIAVLHRPHDDVSGDSYDFVATTPDRLGVLIADARGHGVPAAFVSVMARMVFRGVGQSESSPAAVLRRLNHRLPRLIHAEHFITMFYAVVDRGSLRMSYAAAGHPPPLRYRRATGTVEPLPGYGPMIGVLDDPVFEENTVQLRRGETVLFYTDGVSETRNADGEQFGTTRMAALVAEHASGTADDIVHAIESALIAFGGSSEFDDDVTCLAIQVEPRAVGAV